MNKLIILLAFILPSPMLCGEPARAHVVLPNPGLLGCKAEACAHLWRDGKTTEDAFYPKKLIIEVSERTVRAIYDKSMRLEDIKSEINEDYAKWLLFDGGVTGWRVEDEKFAIGLTEDDEGKQLYYIAFRPWEEGDAAKPEASGRSSQQK